MIIIQWKKLKKIYLLFSIFLFSEILQAQMNTSECIMLNEFLANQKFERLFRDKPLSDTFYFILKKSSEFNDCKSFILDRRKVYFLTDSINRELANKSEPYYHFKKKDNYFILDLTRLKKRKYQIEITQPSTGTQVIYYTKRKEKKFKIIEIKEYIL
jgi:hypothetical protein